MASIIKTVWQTTRPPFLILAPICILLGISLVSYEQMPINWLHASLAIIAAISAHISVNMLNEYTDFRSGLDQQTQKTPFSGGSGGLVINPHAEMAVLIGGIVSLAITSIIGLYFATTQGFAIVPLGLLGILVIVSYTPWLNRSPWLCLIAPGLGFGLLMIMGSYFVLTGHYSLNSFWVALIPFFLTNNLLLLNQFPDIEADKIVGRNHFPIHYGAKNSVLAYGLNSLLAVTVLTVLITQQQLPALALLALIPLFLSFVVFKGAYRYQKQIEKLLPYMGLNVAITLGTPLLLAIVLFLQ